MDQRQAGRLTLVAVLLAYAYYTVWVLVVPFIDRGQPVLRLFPDSYWAFALPVFAGVLLWSVTLTALGCVLVRSQVTKLLRPVACKAKAS